MNATERKEVITQEASISMQREQIVKQLAGVQERLERRGIGAAFHRVAKADPLGDMGFMGGLAFHAVIGGALEGLMGSLPDGLGELDSALTPATVAEGLSALNEAQDRIARRPKSAFYPLGRNKKKAIEKKAAKAGSATRSSRFMADVETDLAYMFELTDMLNRLGEQEAIEVDNKRLHLTVRKPQSSAYQGPERRRRPRPDGMFSA